jgi:uncharacterized protein YqeY
MGLVERVSEQMKAAQKARDTAKLTALRNVPRRAPARDEEGRVADARRRGRDRRAAAPREAARGEHRAFANAGRADRADAERAERAVIESFLPRLADEAQTRAWVQARSPRRAPRPRATSAA